MNNQYNQQPQYQQQYAPQPQRPMIDPMVARQKKRDTFLALSDKMAAFMQTNPILKGISSFSNIIAYFVLGIAVVMSILVMALQKNFLVMTYTALPLVAILFGVLSISKKSILPLTITLSVLSIFNLVNFILNIVTLAELGRSVDAPGSMIIAFICSILEMLIIGGFAALAWMYFVAMLPPRAYAPQQPYYGGQPMQQQPMQQQPVQQPVQPPMQPVQQPVQQQPVQQPMQQPVQQPAADSVQKTCPACGSVNTDDAGFCKICGNKL